MRSENVMIQEMTDKLFRRAHREQNKYRKLLMQQSPADILLTAEEYVIREKILQELRYAVDGMNYYPCAISIPKDHLTALLRSKTPLADICCEFFSDTELYGEADFRCSLQNTILNCGNEIQRQEFLERKKNGDFTYHNDLGILPDDEFDVLYLDNDEWEDTIE